jgi:hypothetical protein
MRWWTAKAHQRPTAAQVADDAPDMSFAENVDVALAVAGIAAQLAAMVRSGQVPITRDARRINPVHILEEASRRLARLPAPPERSAVDDGGTPLTPGKLRDAQPIETIQHPTDGKSERS